MLSVSAYLVIIAMVVWFCWSEYSIRKEIREFCKNEHEKRMNK
jgi:formate hydrogenlyase subunit 3/multisubunit Na+/H+ antiporter MnhD subunit